MKEPNKAVLVYQAGIANVFQVETLNFAPNEAGRKRLAQSDFRTCEAFARGLAAAGWTVASAHCNMAGDVTLQRWSANLDQAPFSDKQRPVFNRVSTSVHFCGDY